MSALVRAWRVPRVPKLLPEDIGIEDGRILLVREVADSGPLAAGRTAGDLLPYDRVRMSSSPRLAYIQAARHWRGVPPIPITLQRCRMNWLRLGFLGFSGRFWSVTHWEPTVHRVSSWRFRYGISLDWLYGGDDPFSEPATAGAR